MNRSWRARSVDSTLVHTLVDSCNLAPLVALTLVARGIESIEEAELFLNPNLERDWSDPLAIPGMSDVTDRLEEALRANKRILVFGDFDVDGISATALMLRGLKALGAQQLAYLIPNRMNEGYGLSLNVLPRVIDAQPDIVITVDCGISSQVEVAELLAQSIEVCITDHHEPSNLAPQDVPIADPKLEADSPLSQLAGAGVALKLIAALGARFGQPDLWRELVDLASLGTIADFMPLQGENRALVAQGLSLMRTARRPGISAVLNLSHRDTTDIRATDLSFSLIPRLNAAGRMGAPDKALELLIDDDPARSQELALALDTANTLRRETESKLLVSVLEQAAKDYHGQKILVIAGEDWHEGIRGIVASRLVSRYGVPVIVFSLVDDEARGSGRSFGAVNLFKAVECCGDMTLRFGGHEAAVGVTVARDRIDEFRQRIEKIMEEEPDENLHPPLLVDTQLALGDISVQSIEELKALEPYGHDNREPLFVSCGVGLQCVRTVGAKKNHLSLTAVKEKGSVQGIWFNCPAVEDFLDYRGQVDIVYRLQIDEWNGRKKPKLMIERIYRLEKLADTSPTTRQEEEPTPADKPSAPDELDTTPLSPGECLSPSEPSVPSKPLSSDELACKIVGAPITLHAAQRSTLEALAQGESVLTVMATGRGKSLIFQIHAAQLALTAKRASIFVFPLRALIADQYRHVLEGFTRLGLSARALSGECTADEKDNIFGGLYEGKIDVLLTTPEFLYLHAWRFSQSNRIGFIVYDEAHHIHPERLANRTAYYELEDLRAQFSQTQYLAVTATSNEHITTDIKKALDIDRVIVDDTRRDNLRINDLRNCPQRDAELIQLIESGGKTIVYINSRPQAITLTRLLRKQLSRKSETIAFYHAGLTRVERRCIEEGFRTGTLTTIISTSAFGEGVNIPDVAQVILYHLPFNAVAFNQMSGRAGRNGQPAYVHLLYSSEDARINEQILLPLIPNRAALVALFRTLTQLASLDPAKKSVASSYEQLARSCKQVDARCVLDEAGVRIGCAIFAELGLLTFEENEPNLRIVLHKDAEKVELSSSSLYLEGEDELALFEQFKTWALEASVEELREQITGPLIPGNDGEVYTDE